MENREEVSRGEELGRFYTTQVSEADQRLRNDVLKALSLSPMLDSSRLDVVVKDGVVFLEGFVEDQEKCKAAEKVVENLMGVTSVENEIKVQAGSLKENRSTKERDIKNKKALEECLSCYQECMRCINHCLQMGGKHSEAAHIKTMLECAEMCNTTAKFILMEGSMAYGVGQLCAKACENCAENCSSVDPHDKVMAACSECCKRCAEVCRLMES